LAVLEGLGDVLQNCRICYVEIHNSDDIQRLEQAITSAGFSEITYFEGHNAIVKFVRY